MESDSSQLNKNAYGIRIYLVREQVSYTKPNSSIFIQSAYAVDCFCPTNTYLARDSILSIKIFTVNDFDSQHAANSDVTDYFKIIHSYQSIENYVANIQYTFGEYRDSLADSEFQIDVLLMTAPTTNNKQQFTVQVALSDGRILEQQTPEIELL
jgi:hypothetical protein